MKGWCAKNKLKIFIFVIILGIGLASVGYSVENIVRFSLVQSETKVDDFLKQKMLIDNNQFDIFAKDNIIYLLNRSVLLDNKDFSCEEMLGTSYSHENSSGSPSNSFQINIEFNSKGKDKLVALSRSNVGERLAIVFDGRLIVDPIIQNQVTDGNLSVNGLSYDDARKLDYVLHKVCAWASNVSFSLVNPDNKCADQKSLPSASVGEYECLSMEGNNYAVSKKAELDSSGFKKAKILLAVRAPFTENKVQELGSEDIPWRFDEEEEAAHDVHAFQVKIELNENGRKVLKKLSENNAGQELATVFEDRLYYVERIPRNTTSDFVLVNGLTYNQAKRLTNVINRNE